MQTKIEELSKVFDTETKRKIIQLLLSLPDKEWYGKEIALKINVTPASIYQQIDALVKEKVVIEVKKGRMRFFRLNSNHWFIKQLK